MNDPVGEGSAAALRDAVLDRLTALEQFAGVGEPGSGRPGGRADTRRAGERGGDLASALPLARTELSRLADGWRLLLTGHGVGEDGRCRACHGWVRHRRWPCPVWLTAHRHLVEDAPPAESEPERRRWHRRRGPLDRLSRLNPRRLLARRAERRSGNPAGRKLARGPETG